MRTDDGRSIYESDRFIVDEQADYYRDASTLDAARDKLAWVVRHSRGGGRLLDVGANLGYFAREAATRFDAIGIEPGAQTVSWGREHLGAPVQVGSIEDPHPEFTRRFDAITMFDVIEHLPDPAQALARCREWLAPGGRLFLTTPDTGSLMARLLGRHWYYIDLTEHISLFSRQSLSTLLARTGFRIVATRTIGRSYKLSYIERRLGQLSTDAWALRPLHVLSLPLRFATRGRIPLNLGDVMGVVAEVE